MAQKSVQDYIREFLSPILITIVGYYTISTLNEIKSDIKTLLETKAVHTEQLRALERKVFALYSIQIRGLDFIFDKTKTLKYDGGVFYYA